jgi:hypothetical protein
MIAARPIHGTKELADDLPENLLAVGAALRFLVAMFFVGTWLITANAINKLNEIIC